MMIAQVIVDVNVETLNRPFDYKVPNNLEELIEIGARVIVPFGPRKLMGFVLHVLEETETKIEDLKEIETLLDLKPVVTNELMLLAKRIAKDTSANLIHCLKLMIPAAMKPDYRKYYMYNQQKVYLDTLHDQELKEVKKSDLEILYEVKEKGSIKFKSFIRLQQKDYLPTSAAQKELLDLLINQGTVEKSILSKISLSALNTLLKKKVLLEEMEESYRHQEEIGVDKVVTLSPEQQEIVNQVKPGVSLIHGVTGSGKTELYLTLIEQLDDSLSAICLVPEISITYHLISRFNARFPGKVAVLHSGLSMGERYDEFRKIMRGEAKIVIGARSAIFAPCTKLGMIIVDEEHEHTYKQEESPRYHAREVAKLRGIYHNCPVVLGSATPSVESYARAKRGVYRLFELKNRYFNELPEIKIVDMKEEEDILSKDLVAALKTHTSKNKQAMLLINRRGYSNFVLCPDCGEVLKCQDCDVSLTYHKYSNKCTCHYCGYSEPKPTKCPSCGKEHLTFVGIGTEQLEQMVQELLPQKVVKRMDQDTTSKKGSAQKLLKDFEAKKIDVLIGTQMIAKGLDFEDVTLVGVVSCDQLLFLSDFRAAESTYQLLTQVAGRAGRHQHPGTVYLQTYNPDHYAIVAVRKTYEEFYEEEMEYRKLGGYVPYYYMETVQIRAKTFELAYQEAKHIRDFLKKGLSNQAVVLGPTVPYISRIQNMYRVQLVLKYKSEPQLESLLNELEHLTDKKVQLIIDRYPLQIGS